MQGTAFPWLGELPDDSTDGNGAQELRNWLTTAAIADDAGATVLAYEPVAEWLTGTAIVRFEL